MVDEKSNMASWVTYMAQNPEASGTRTGWQMFWVAVEEFKVSYYNKETLSFSTRPCYCNLINLSFLTATQFCTHIVMPPKR